MKSKLIYFDIMGDERGSLIALEENHNIPFDIKRVFYIYGTQHGIPRGKHSHYVAKQLLIVLHGSCKVTLDNGKEKQTFLLDSPTFGLYQDTLVWGFMHDFSTNCVLMVVSDTYYDEKDYIRDYDKFLEEVNK